MTNENELEASSLMNDPDVCGLLHAISMGERLKAWAISELYNKLPDQSHTVLNYLKGIAQQRAVVPLPPLMVRDYMRDNVLPFMSDYLLQQLATGREAPFAASVCSVQVQTPQGLEELGGTGDGAIQLERQGQDSGGDSQEGGGTGEACT